MAKPIRPRSEIASHAGRMGPGSGGPPTAPPVQRGHGTAWGDGQDKAIMRLYRTRPISELVTLFGAPSANAVRGRVYRIRHGLR